ATFGDRPGVEFGVQAEQKGTGHAVSVCREALAGWRGPVVVLAGDGPMVRAELVAGMLERFAATKAKAFVASAVVGDATGLGRIERHADGRFKAIVEHRDATPAQREIREINPSFYVFDGPALFETLAQVKPANAQGEYYLTDVPGLLAAAGETVAVEPLADETDMAGVNHRRQLAEIHALMQKRIQDHWMDAGVTIVDPRTTVIEAGVVIGRDTIVEPFTVLRGPATIGGRCRIGPFALVPAGSVVADDACIGPMFQPPA
ncbi:MAG: sugar phosphate nucleotidyltransferase, partial [Planctomycetia bacterium]